MATLTDIENHARLYAAHREKLSTVVADLNTALEALKRQRLPAIRRALDHAAQTEGELRELIAAAPHLFVKPRTVIFHGVKIGYAKGKGAIEWGDPEQVIRLIRRHLPDQAEALIVTRETPAKAALANLSVADLKRIGCAVTESGDEIVLRATDSALDKMVDALLKSAVGDAVEAA